MDTLMYIETTLTALIAAGTGVKIILLFIQAAMNPEEKKSYYDEVKSVLIAFIISLLIASGSVVALIYNYLGS